MKLAHVFSSVGEGSDLANQLATKVVELNDEYKVPENLELQRCESTSHLLMFRSRSCQQASNRDMKITKGPTKGKFVRLL